MTLGDLANHICGKLLKSDDASLEKAKEYLRMRHRLVWDAFLWKDSVVTFPDLLVPINPDTSDYRAEVVLPDAIARPLLVWPSNAEGLLTPGELLDIARTENDGTAQRGSLVGFTELSSTGLPVPASASTYSLRFAADVDDLGKEIGIQYGGERDDNLWGITPDGLYTDQTTTVILAAGAVWNTIGFKIGRMTKPVTAARVTVFIRDNSGTVSWMWPAESTVAEFARIRLIDRPTVVQYGSDYRIGVLGKRKPRSFVRDNDSPALRGSENALISLATGDMLERDRMYAKAAQKFNEGDAMVRVMKDNELNQSAHVARIMPEEYTAAGCRDDFGW